MDKKEGKHEPLPSTSGSRKPSPLKRDASPPDLQSKKSRANTPLLDFDRPASIPATSEQIPIVIDHSPLTEAEVRRLERRARRERRRRQRLEAAVMTIEILEDDDESDSDSVSYMLSLQEEVKSTRQRPTPSVQSASDVITIESDSELEDAVEVKIEESISIGEVRVEQEEESNQPSTTIVTVAQSDPISSTSSQDPDTLLPSTDFEPDYFDVLADLRTQTRISSHMVSDHPGPSTSGYSGSRRCHEEGPLGGPTLGEGNDNSIDLLHQAPSGDFLHWLDSNFDEGATVFEEVNALFEEISGADHHHQEPDSTLSHELDWEAMLQGVETFGLSEEDQDANPSTSSENAK